MSSTTSTNPTTDGRIGINDDDDDGGGGGGGGVGGGSAEEEEKEEGRRMYVRNNDYRSRPKDVKNEESPNVASVKLEQHEKRRRLHHHLPDLHHHRSHLHHHRSHLHHHRQRHHHHNIHSRNQLLSRHIHDYGQGRDDRQPQNRSQSGKHHHFHLASQRTGEQNQHQRPLHPHHHSTRDQFHPSQHQQQQIHHQQSHQQQPQKQRRRRRSDYSNHATVHNGSTNELINLGTVDERQDATLIQKYYNNHDTTNNNSNNNNNDINDNESSNNNSSNELNNEVIKQRVKRNHYFQIIEVNIIIHDVNDNPPIFFPDETSDEDSSYPVGEVPTKWENETLLLLSINILENLPPGRKVPIPGYVEDPDWLDAVSGKAIKFDQSGNCSNLLGFYAESESETSYAKRTKRNFPEQDRQQYLMQNILDANAFQIMQQEHFKEHHQQNKKHRTIRATPSSTTSHMFLTVLENLDRETDDHCSMDIVARDSDDNYSKTLRLVINFDDVNDNRPKFESDVIRIEIEEDRQPSPNKPLMFVKATDLDSGEHGRIIYSFSRATQSALGKFFRIDSDTGAIYLKTRLNTPEATAGLSNLQPIPSVKTLEDQHVSGSKPQQLDDRSTRGFVLKITASNPTHGQTSQAEVIVAIRDVNDNAPSIRVSPELIEITEEQSEVGVAVGHITVDDLDTGDNGKTDCGFATSGHSSTQQRADSADELLRLSRVNQKIYRIFTGKKLDREKTAQHRVVLFCWDYGYPASLNTSREIVIRVLDINDNIPNFLQSSYSADVEENNSEGSAVLKVSAVDIDEGPNAEITYSIVNVSHEAGSDVKQRKSHSSQNIGDKETGVDNEFVSNNDDDNNDDDDDNEKNKETTTSYSNNALLHFKEEDDSPSYDISNFDDVLSSFTLDQTTGTLYAKRHFDYETTKYFKFFVLATDNAQKIGGKPLSSRALVTINIQDANDESPKFSKDRYEFTISENAPMKTEVGVLQVTDADETAKFSRFNLTIESSFPPSSSSDGSGSGFFQLEPQTGVIWTTRTLDREQYAVHHLWLVARNTASPYLSGTAHVIVHVTDTNDNAPLIEYPSHDNYTVHVDCALEPGAPVARIRARDADLGENASLDYSVAKGNELGLIEVDGKSGLVSLVVYPLEVAFRRHHAQNNNYNNDNDDSYINHDISFKHFNKSSSKNNIDDVITLLSDVTFVVKDNGSPSKSAETRMLLVVANCSKVNKNSKNNQQTSSGNNYFSFFENWFSAESSKELFSRHEVIISLSAIFLAIILVIILLVVCVKAKKRSRNNSAVMNNNNGDIPNNSKLLVVTNDNTYIPAKKQHQSSHPVNNGNGNIYFRQQQPYCKQSSHVNGAKDDNVKNERLLMLGGNKMVDDDVSKFPVGSHHVMLGGNHSYHDSPTLEKYQNGLQSFSPTIQSNQDSLSRLKSSLLQQQQQQQGDTHSTNSSTFQQQQQQCCQQQQQICKSQHGSSNSNCNTFQRNNLRPSLKLLQQEISANEQRKHSAVSNTEVNRLLDILKSNHDEQHQLQGLASDWPHIDDFNQSDIIWGPSVDDVIDDDGDDVIDGDDGVYMSGRQMMLNNGGAS